MKFHIYGMMLCCLSINLFYSSIDALPVMYSIGVQFPRSLSGDQMVSIPAYYRGNKITLCHWTSLAGCQPCSILIAESVDFSNKGNTIHYLKRNLDIPCRWFDLTLHFTEELDETGKKQSRYTWDIEERKEKDLPVRIPEHTLVVLANPDFVSALTPELVALGSVDIVLPTIRFKQDIDEQELHDSMLKVTMGSAMNLNAIHGSAVPCVTCKECVVISAVKPAYEPR